VTLTFDQLQAIVNRVSDAEETIAMGVAMREAALAELRALVGTEQPGDGEAPSVASTTPPAQEHPEPGKDASSDGAPAVTGHQASESQLEAGGSARTAAPPADPLACPDCDRTFPRAQALGRHRSAIHGTPSQRSVTSHPCPKGCGRDFSYPNNAAKHARRCRGPRVAAEAPVVDDVENPPSSAAPWQPKPEGTGSAEPPVIHGGKERWLCNRCPAFFPTQESRDRHQASHPEIPPLVTDASGVRGNRSRPSSARSRSTATPTPIRQDGFGQ
jgi:hypothetical protein